MNNRIMLWIIQREHSLKIDDDLELALEFVREQKEFMQVSAHSQSFYLLFF